MRISDIDELIEKTRIHFFAQSGDIEKVKSLIAEGVPVNHFDEISYTPLHHATASGHLEIVKYLLQNGADVNIHEEENIGNTVLREIASNCTFEMAKMLIDAGADPTIPGWMNTTALDKSQERKKPEGQRVHQLLYKAACRLNPKWSRLNEFKPE